MRPEFLSYQNQTKTSLKEDKHRPVSLMNIHARILNRVSANWIQLYNKRSYTTSKWDLLQWCKDGSTPTYQSGTSRSQNEDWKSCGIATDAEKAADTIKKNFFNVYFWDRERHRVWAGEGQRERETQSPNRAPVSELSAQSPTWGSDSQSLRDHDVSRSQPPNWLSHPGALQSF